jgi:hypothetical protein
MKLDNPSLNLLQSIASDLDQACQDIMCVMDTYPTVEDGEYPLKQLNVIDMKIFHARQEIIQLLETEQ